MAKPATLALLCITVAVVSGAAVWLAMRPGTGDERSNVLPGAEAEPATATVASAATAVPTPATTAPGVFPSSGVAFADTFDAQPGSPMPFREPHWDVQVHKRDHNVKPGVIDPMDAQHGPGCEGPDVTHHVAAVEDVVFLCRDHVMTALNAGDYGLVYLTPDHMVDFSRGEAVVRVDVSTFRSSTRDWWDIWITPWGDQIPRPFDNFDVDLQGPPRNGLKVGIVQENVLCITEYRDGVAVSPGHLENGCVWWEPYEGWLEPDKARRDTFELRITPSAVSIGMPAYDRIFHTWEPATPIPWTQGVVQFGHHSYTPTKDGAGEPATWHWDNIEISPAVPFRIIPSTGGYHEYLRADWQTACPGDCEVTFTEPAGANAVLRFAAWGPFQLDVGNGWESVQPRLPIRKPEHASSYVVPVPEGTNAARFKFGESGAPTMATGFAIWSAP